MVGCKPRVARKAVYLNRRMEVQTWAIPAPVAAAVFYRLPIILGTGENANKICQASKANECARIFYCRACSSYAWNRFSSSLPLSLTNFFLTTGTQLRHYLLIWNPTWSVWISLVLPQFSDSFKFHNRE